mmetsp:Transcript_56686/g.51005  ORF Transcript_56686/g.51005 Transcript_56686/m.51005 type:complete len:203 (-) Transcript_56686:86-694(-)
MGCGGSTENLPSISIVFLDVDGVLNSAQTNMCGIDKEHLDNLDYIIRQTNNECKIVLSTTWRNNENSKQQLIQRLQTELKIDGDINDFVIGSTPLLHDKQRANEINQYFKVNRKQLNKTYNIESWVALDDMALDKPNEECKQIMKGHFVKINSEFGLSLTHAKMAVNILNGNESANAQYMETINKKEAEIDAQTAALYAKYT